MGTPPQCVVCRGWLNQDGDPCRSCAGLGPALRVYVPWEPDQIVVEELVAGHRMPGARKADRREAALVLLKRHSYQLDRGMMRYKDIAERVGLSSRSIERYAASLGFRRGKIVRGAHVESHART